MVPLAPSCVARIGQLAKAVKDDEQQYQVQNFFAAQMRDFIQANVETNVKQNEELSTVQNDTTSMPSK
jgi:hypothetical protein